MDEQEARDAPECGQREAFPAGDEHILPQLQSAARQSDDDQRLEHAVLRSGQLVAEDHRDSEHELDLLLERIEGLARDRAYGEHGSKAWRDGSGSAQRAGRRDAAARGTDELPRQLITGVERVSGAQASDLGPDRRLAVLHRMVERFEDETELRRELLEVHGAEATGLATSAKKSQQTTRHSNPQLRLCRDKA